jgi:hypothetical protein
LTVRKRRGAEVRPFLSDRAINGPYRELFARQQVAGWDCFGNSLRQPAQRPGLVAAECDHRSMKLFIRMRDRRVIRPAESLR